LPEKLIFPSKMTKALKTVVLASGFWRLKAPRWHLDALCVSDVSAGKVFRIDLDGRVTIIADVLNRPFGLGFLPDKDLLVVLITQRLILKFGAEKQTIHTDVADAAVGYLRDLGVRLLWKRLCDVFRLGDAYGPDYLASARILLATPDSKIRSAADNIAFERVAITCAHMEITDKGDSRKDAFTIFHWVVVPMPALRQRKALRRIPDVETRM
jgi:hypothetical protein